jgi:hypothetical protein
MSDSWSKSFARTDVATANATKVPGEILAGSDVSGAMTFGVDGMMENVGEAERHRLEHMGDNWKRR